MEYLHHEVISYCTVFELKLSQDELEVYESCLKYILENCNDEIIYQITGCRKTELNSWHSELKEMILKYVRKDLLPDKYK